MAEYLINLIWDDEAKVWYSTSNDIGGLLLESASMDKLIARIRLAAPELLALNGITDKEFVLRFQSERVDKIAV